MPTAARLVILLLYLIMPSLTMLLECLLSDAAFPSLQALMI